jgi:hypothetical protein
VKIFSCTWEHEVVRVRSEMSNSLWPKNLTPGPFPSGKGSKMKGVPVALPIIWFPFPLGKGLGVRFSICI